MNAQLQELKESMIVNLGSTIADTRPDWGSNVSDRNVTLACLNILAKYVESQTPFLEAMPESFGLAFIHPQIAELMAKLSYQQVLKLLPEQFQSNENAEWLAVTTTSL